VIRDDYELDIKHSTHSSVQGEIFQVALTPDGKRISLPVGLLSAWKDPGDEVKYRPHWKAHLFLVDTYEYDSATRVTVRSDRDRHQWQLRGIEVSPGPLPPYDPALPRATGEVLLLNGLCAKPLWVQVHHGRVEGNLQLDPRDQ